MVEVQIKQIKSFPIPGFESLKKESQGQGFNFLARLEEEWENGKNRFLGKGEGVYLVLHDNELIAIGGINQDPYLSDKNSGRLRRFYVKSSMRRKKLGKKLLEYIMQKHGADFEGFSLFTDNANAANFYESNGFEKIEGVYKVSHRKIAPFY